MGIPFPANVQRFDPYKNSKFQLYFGDSASPVAGVNKVGGLKRTAAAVEYREGGNAIVRKGLGRMTYTAITLDRGVTHDTDFEAWANAAQVLDHGVPSQSLANLRKELRIELLNEAGQPVLRWIVHRAWVSEYQALSDLDAGGNAVAIEHMSVEHEGWERDTTLSMPSEI